MPQVAGISEAEWDVIKVLWDAGPSTAGQIVAGVAGTSRRWRPRTIKTLLARLVKKGAVRREVDADGRHVYRAALTRQAAVRRESKSFLARVFNGALVPAVATMLRESDLSPADLQQLKQILENEARR